MAANRILDGFQSFTKFVNDGFKYNLQVFPDTITASALLFALLFQSPSFGAFGGSLILLNFIHPAMASFLSRILPNLVTAGDSERCSGRFPGVSYERLMTTSFGALDKTTWPSYYATFLGFLTAYIGSLPVIYQKELSASPRREAAVYGGIGVLVLIVLICLMYRFFTGCDGVGSAAVGMISGTLLGIAAVVFLAWISDRRATNILAFPLIRDRAADGKPGEVCERGE